MAPWCLSHRGSKPLTWHLRPCLLHRPDPHFCRGDLCHRTTPPRTSESISSNHPLHRLEIGQRANQETQQARSKVTFKQQTPHPGGSLDHGWFSDPLKRHVSLNVWALSLTTYSAWPHSVIEADEDPDRCFKERRWGDSTGEPIDSFLGRRSLAGEKKTTKASLGASPHTHLTPSALSHFPWASGPQNWGPQAQQGAYAERQLSAKYRVNNSKNGNNGKRFLKCSRGFVCQGAF